MEKCKLERKSIPLKTKIKILDRLAAGERVIKLANRFNLGESTIRTIRKNEKTIRLAVTSGVDINATSTTSYSRNPFLKETEKALISWIKEMKDKKTPISKKEIRNQALILYNQFENDDGSTSPTKKFTASKGWLVRFLKRYDYLDIDLTDKNISTTEKSNHLIDIKIETVQPFEESENKIEENVIRKGIKLCEELEKLFLHNDPNLERAQAFHIGLTRCMAEYRKLLSNK